MINIIHLNKTKKIKKSYFFLKSISLTRNINLIFRVFAVSPGEHLTDSRSVFDVDVTVGIDERRRR